LNIVIIHGFSSLKGEERLKLLIEEIKKELPKAKIIVPNYQEGYSRPKIRAGRKTVIEYAKICKDIIEKERLNEELLVIIAYSFGGLIARELTEEMQIQAKAVILVGTPNKGIKLSWWERLLLKIFKRPFIEDMMPESKFLVELNENYEKNRPRINYYLIAGEEDNRVPQNSAIGIEARERIILPIDHSGLIPRKYTGRPNAIWDIIKILKKEAGFQTASFFIFIPNLKAFLLDKI